MKQVGVAALLALCLASIGCAGGVALDSKPLAGAKRTDRIQDLSMAIAASPRDPKFYVERAYEYERNGEYKSAIADFNTAMSLRPDDAQYLFKRGVAYAYAGDETAAKQDFARANAMAPGSVEAYNEQAWLMATAPNPGMRDARKAVEYATRACEMTRWQDPSTMETLAAAYAESGNFDEAIKWQQKAVNLTPTTFLTTLDQRRSRLALYQQHQPWRPTPPLHPIATS
jgi:tetratricopeptide (TPR) repeat protein